MSRRIFLLLGLIFTAVPNATANPLVAETNKSNSAQNQSSEARYDLTGYWKYGDDRVLYFTHKGSNLRSHHTKRAPDYAHLAKEIDFSANIAGNLVHGVQKIRLPWPMHNRCPADMNVGIGLTMNDSYTKLTGFRASRTVNLVDCTVGRGEPDRIEYTRMLDANGKPKK